MQVPNFIVEKILELLGSGAFGICWYLDLRHLGELDYGYHYLPISITITVSVPLTLWRSGTLGIDLSVSLTLCGNGVMTHQHQTIFREVGLIRISDTLEDLLWVSLLRYLWHFGGVGLWVIIDLSLHQNHLNYGHQNQISEWTVTLMRGILVFPWFMRDTHKKGSDHKSNLKKTKKTGEKRTYGYGKAELRQAASQVRKQVYHSNHLTNSTLRSLGLIYLDPSTQFDRNSPAGWHLPTKGRAAKYPDTPHLQSQPGCHTLHVNISTPTQIWSSSPNILSVSLSVMTPDWFSLANRAYSRVCLCLQSQVCLFVSLLNV